MTSSSTFLCLLCFLKSPQHFFLHACQPQHHSLEKQPSLYGKVATIPYIVSFSMHVNLNLALQKYHHQRHFLCMFIFIALFMHSMDVYIHPFLQLICPLPSTNTTANVDSTGCMELELPDMLKTTWSTCVTHYTRVTRSANLRRRNQQLRSRVLEAQS